MTEARADTGAGGDKRTWRDTVTVYFTPVMLSMLVLGFASGLPLYMVFQKLSFWLRDAGIERSTIGFFYWVTIAYSLKWLWAPVVDRVQVPVLNGLLGRRRSWIVTAIAGTVAALAIVGTTNPSGADYVRGENGERLVEIGQAEYDVLISVREAALTPEAPEDEVAAERAVTAAAIPAEAGEVRSSPTGEARVRLPVEVYEDLVHLVDEAEDSARLGDARPALALLPVIIAALLLAYSGATLDVAIDAWRIESAPNDMQANMAAAYSLGYRGAYLMSGLGLAVAEFANWHVSFFVMSGAMAVTAGLVFFMKEPAAGARKAALTGNFGVKVAKAVIEPFKQMGARLGFWLIAVIALVSLYRMSDFTMGVMASPLYSDLGFNKAVVGGVQTGPGLAATIFGLFIGGIAAFRFGLIRALMAGLVITFVTNAAFAWLAATGDSDSVWKLTLAIVGDNLAGGYVTTVFIAYLSSLVDPDNAATQYAVLASLYALFAKFLSGFSGVIADALGYTAFFLLTAAWTIPAAVLLTIIVIFGPKAAKGQFDFGERRLAEETAVGAEDTRQSQDPPEKG
ncbi:MAG: MFS transporter [Oceanicaulis sp.]